MLKSLNIFDDIQFDGTNPRTDTGLHSAAAQQALVDSLRTSPLQNLPSINLRDGVYTLIQGHRRVEALRTLHKECPAKHPATVDCTIFEDLTDEQVAAMRLTENIVRQDLSGIEIGLYLKDYKKLILSRNPKETDGKIAASVGLPQPRFSQYIKITRLPQGACDAVLNRSLDMAHAEQLAKLLPKQKKGEEIPLDPELSQKIDELAEMAVDKDLSEEKLGKIIDSLLNKKPQKPDKEPLKGAYKKVLDSLISHFGEGVVQVKQKKGGCTFVFDVTDGKVADVQAMLTRGEPAYGSADYWKAHPVEYAVMQAREAAEAEAKARRETALASDRILISRHGSASSEFLSEDEATPLIAQLQARQAHEIPGLRRDYTHGRIQNEFHIGIGQDKARYTVYAPADVIDSFIRKEPKVEEPEVDPLLGFTDINEFFDSCPGVKVGGNTAPPRSNI